MPQMAPLSWLTMFIIFSFTLIFFGIMNYFLVSPDAPQSSSSSFQTQPFNWKW